jgi:hypothetical protein
MQHIFILFCRRNLEGVNNIYSVLQEQIPYSLPRYRQTAVQTPEPGMNLRDYYRQKSHVRNTRRTTAFPPGNRRRCCVCRPDRSRTGGHCHCSPAGRWRSAPGIHSPKKMLLSVYSQRGRAASLVMRQSLSRSQALSYHLTFRDHFIHPSAVRFGGRCRCQGRDLHRGPVAPLRWRGKPTTASLH